MKEKIKVVVSNKTEILFDADCSSVSSKNALGAFDVLPEHINYMSLIEGEVLACEVSGKIWKGVCERGMVRVSSNAVEVIFFS